MKLKRFLTGVLSAVMALSVCALPAAAADVADTTTTAPSTSTIDTGKKGSITIHKYVMTNVGDAKTSNNGETVDASEIPAGATAASGAKFTLYKVMAQDDLIKYYNGENATYKDKEPVYTDFVDDNSGTYTIKSDATVAGYTPVDATTDKNGLAKFGGLDIGLYVVIETETPKAVTKPVTPFLVSVPMTKVVTADSKQTATEWLYDIHVYPKNSTAVGEVTLKKMGAVGDKTDKSAAPLAGVQFKLEHLRDGADANEEANWEHIKNENDGDYFTTADKTGVLTVKGLKPGIYRFTEIGYATGSENKFIINDGAKYVFEVTANKDGTVTVSKPLDAENNADYEAKNSQVTVYNYAPDADKDVKDRVKGGYQQGADYAVGDTIEYKVKVVIPANIGKLKNFFLTDTPTNLKDKTDSIKFYSDAECATEIASTDILVGTDGIAAYATDGFKITFDTTKLNDKLYAGKTIYIKYNAELKKEAAVTTTEGNHNTIDLTYSKKTSTDSTGAETENDWNKIEDTAVVYTFQIDITKTDGSKNALNGVEFDLYDEVAKGTADTLTEEQAKALGFTNTSVAYKKVDHGVTAGSGKLTFKGLSNSSTNVAGGTNRYWLVETKTVNGYNLLAKPVEAKLSIAYMTKWTEKNKYENGKFVKHERTEVKEMFDPDEVKNGRDEAAVMNSGKQKGTDKDGTTIGSLRTEIINKKGFQLPVTGGFGTLLFSGIGVLLVLAGVAVLFSMKKKNDRA
ncbi:SpaH/EbpB family LPXTG-anchored major pilin [Gemmiger sp.]|uniref:SpaH/EbpB family LPXTG-anchored major pilin n=1 Tax=Gemmiger sp. TaxID=2049027 RepID=UPI003A910202